MTILSCHAWSSNAALIADVASLWLEQDMVTLDATYGYGVWWQHWKPHWLVAFDGDFRELPYEDEAFDLVAFDPPYVSIGGRHTSTIVEMHQRYGNLHTPKNPRLLQETVVNVGLAECWRVCKRGGLVLVKCMDYVSSGKLWFGTYWTAQAAMELNMTLVDKFVHLNNGRPQPSARRQVHARENASVLYLFRPT